MDFWTYGLRKKRLVKCLKSPLSEDASTTKMVKGWNTVQSLTTASLPYLLIPVKEIQICSSLGLFVNQLTAMTSILFWTEAIYCNIFRCLYLRNEKYLLNFLLHFINLDTIFHISKKNINLIADVLLNWRTSTNVVR